MSASRSFPVPARGPAPSATAPDMPAWARDQAARALRALEGRGPAAEARTRSNLARVQRAWRNGPALPGGDPEGVRDLLWGALLTADLPATARFFRPLRTRRGPVLWVQRRDGGADALARERVETVLARFASAAAGGGLDGARIHRQCWGLLRNGLGERELARALDLTSPGQAAVLTRLTGST